MHILIPPGMWRDVDGDASRLKCVLSSHHRCGFQELAASRLAPYAPGAPDPLLVLPQDYVRITITGPGAAYSTILRMKTVAPDVLVLAGGPSLQDRLRDHHAQTDRERMLVTLQWLHDHGENRATAMTINSALRAAAEEPIRYVGQAFRRSSVAGECRAVGWGEYTLTESGAAQLAQFRGSRLPTPGHTRVVQKRAVQAQHRQ